MTKKNQPNTQITYQDYQSFINSQEFDAKANFYTNVDPGISIRAPYSQDVYDFYRPNERVPSGNSQDIEHEIMRMCKHSYETVGVLRTIIDLMSDFGSDGVRLEHPDSAPQIFYDAWIKKVNLKDRAERFLNWLFKSGNVVIRRQYFEISKGKSGPKTKLALRYIMYDPSTVHLIGGPKSVLSTAKQYAIYLPTSVVNTNNVVDPLTQEKPAQTNVPSEVNKMQNKGLGRYVPIPIKETYVAHYKKDDTDIWAKSFLYSVLSDIQYHSKIKMAKVSALDGVINVIRLWKIGDHKEKLFPSPEQFSKLSNILQMNTGGGAADILWGSDIELQEFYPPIDRLANLEPDIKDVLIGIGVSGVLLGVGDNAAGGNPYIGLKNLIQKIQYGREVLTAWINYEIDEIQKEMGFNKRPFIRFNNENLSDERTYYNLLVQLLDRNVISDATVLERIKEIPEMEKARMFQETAMRDSGELPDKAGPFFNPQAEDQRKHEINKIKVQNSYNETKKKLEPQKTNGRPPASKDSYQRTRRDRPKLGRASIMIEANRIYNELDNFLTNAALAEYKAKDFRSLTSEQKKTIENSLHELFPLIDPSIMGLQDAMAAIDIEHPEGPVSEFKSIYTDSLKDIGAEKLNLDQKRILRINAYVEAWLGYN